MIFAHYGRPLRRWTRGDTSGVCSAPSFVIARLRARALALDLACGTCCPPFVIGKAYTIEASTPRRKSSAMRQLYCSTRCARRCTSLASVLGASTLLARGASWSGAVLPHTFLQYCSQPASPHIILKITLIADRCSVTAAASDDEFRIPTNTPGQNRGRHFPTLAGLASTYKTFSTNTGIGVLSVRPCSLLAGVFLALPMSHLFIMNASKSSGQHGRPNDDSLQCSGLANHKSHRAFDDSVVLALSHWWSL